MRPREAGGVLEKSGVVEVVSSLERDGRPVFRDLRWGVYVVLEAPNDYAADCFRQYGLKTDASGRYAAMYKPYHLIGLELNISILSAALRNEPTGQPHGFRGDVASVAKRDLRAGEMLDGEGGYTVWGKLMPAAREPCRRRAADRPCPSRQAEERRRPWRGGALERRRGRRQQRHHQDAQGDGSGVCVEGLTRAASRLARAWLNHLRNIASVSIISVKPAWLIFTVETIDGGPGLGLAVAHAVIGILERQADERLPGPARPDRACAAARPTARSISDIPAPATAARLRRASCQAHPQSPARHSPR